MGIGHLGSLILEVDNAIVKIVIPGIGPGAGIAGVPRWMGCG
jgi:hypothetical protein